MNKGDLVWFQWGYKRLRGLVMEIYPAISALRIKTKVLKQSVIILDTDIRPPSRPRGRPSGPNSKRKLTEARQERLWNEFTAGKSLKEIAATECTFPWQIMRSIDAHRRRLERLAGRPPKSA